MKNQKKDTRSRNWSLTVSCEKMTRTELLRELDSYNYVGQEEIGDGGFHHFQIFVQSKNPVKFSTLKRKFPTAHIETLKGSTQQLYDYVTKKDTRVEGSEFSKGEITLSNQGAATMDFKALRQEIEGGTRLSDLILSEAITGPNLKALEAYEQALIKKRAKNKFRDVEVNYLYGESGTGKTRHVYEKYGYDQVYRITNYKNPFDTYDGEPVLLMDEFYESFDFGYLLNLLDGYPLQMAARYYDRWAEYTTVWIVSNRRLDEQYKVHANYNKTEYLPFLRRINNSYTKTESGIYLNNEFLDSCFPPEKRG